MTKLQYNTTPPTLSVSGSPVEPQCGTRGSQSVQILGVDNSQGTGVLATQPDGAPFTAALATAQFPYVWNGTTYDKLVKANAVSRLASSAATNNATSAKASAGNLFTISGVNTNAAARYLKFYNKASAPNPAADTVFWSLYLPPTAVVGGVFQIDFGAMPLYFSTGIAWALVTGSGDTDNTAVGAGDILALAMTYA